MTTENCFFSCSGTKWDAAGNLERRGGIMDSSAPLSPAPSWVWHGSVMRDGAASPAPSVLHCYPEETSNAAVGPTHCLQGGMAGGGSPAPPEAARANPAICESVRVYSNVNDVSGGSHQTGEAGLSLWELESSVNRHGWEDAEGHQPPFICCIGHKDITWLTALFSNIGSLLNDLIYSNKPL